MNSKKEFQIAFVNALKAVDEMKTEVESGNKSGNTGNKSGNNENEVEPLNNAN